MNKRKVIVIGAGISGLSAGIYAARSGFDVTILEQHMTFGGLSTGWSRKGYFFEGGMHWLTGSSPKVALNEIWKETGALRENNPIENRDPIYTVFDGKEEVSLYRNPEKMRDEFLSYAPEDKKMIMRFYKDVKAFSKFYMPVTDLPGVKCKKSRKMSFAEFKNMLPLVPLLPRLLRLSCKDYIAKFKNKNIRHLLSSVIGYRYNALSVIYTIGSFASGDCGYPKGGSVILGKNMVEKFLELGGKIIYRTKAEKVFVENGLAKGVQTKDGLLSADAVIITQDAYVAVDSLFEEKVSDKWVKTMKKHTKGEQNMFISFGVKKNYSNLPYCMILPLDKPFEYGGLKFTEIRLNNYSKYKDLSPQDCASFTCLLLGHSYDFWKKAKEDGSYKQKKAQLADKLADIISLYIPDFKENIEVIDVATPCTYERYCSSYQGSWMSVFSPKLKQYNYPLKLKSIKRVYFAGQRMNMPGGLPLALNTGRLAVQNLCFDTNTIFV